MDYQQWKPLGLVGDPLQYEPTFDYAPPSLDKVKYWGESQSTNYYFTPSSPPPQFQRKTYNLFNKMINNPSQMFPFSKRTERPNFRVVNDQKPPYTMLMPPRITSYVTSSPKPFVFPTDKPTTYHPENNWKEMSPPKNFRPTRIPNEILTNLQLPESYIQVMFNQKNDSNLSLPLLPIKISQPQPFTFKLENSTSFELPSDNLNVIKILSDKKPDEIPLDELESLIKHVAFTTESPQKLPQTLPFDSEPVPFKPIQKLPIQTNNIVFRPLLPTPLPLEPDNYQDGLLAVPSIQSPQPFNPQTYSETTTKSANISQELLPSDKLVRDVSKEVGEVQKKHKIFQPTPVPKAELTTLPVTEPPSTTTSATTTTIHPMKNSLYAIIQGHSKVKKYGLNSLHFNAALQNALPTSHEKLIFVNKELLANHNAHNVDMFFRKSRDDAAQQHQRNTAHEEFIAQRKARTGNLQTLKHYVVTRLGALDDNVLRDEQKEANLGRVYRVAVGGKLDEKYQKGIVIDT